MLIIKAHYNLPNRQTEGFVRSIFERVGIQLSVPDHTTLLERVIGDGAYDTKEVYRVVKEHNPCAKVIVPPRRSGKIIQHGNSSGDRHRRGEH